MVSKAEDPPTGTTVLRPPGLCERLAEWTMGCLEELKSVLVFLIIAFVVFMAGAHFHEQQNRVCRHTETLDTNLADVKSMMRDHKDFMADNAVALQRETYDLQSSILMLDARMRSLEKQP